MLKKIAKISAIFAVLYAILWAIMNFALGTVTQELNKHAGQILPIPLLGVLGQKYSFTKSEVDRYTLVPKIRIIGFYEENQNTVIQHQEPVIVGYNILQGKFFAQYRGNSIISLKSVEAGTVYNAKYQTNYGFYLPVIKGLVRCFKDKNFQTIIDNIYKVEIQIKDVVLSKDDKVLYTLDKANLIVSTKSQLFGTEHVTPDNPKIYKLYANVANERGLAQSSSDCPDIFFPISLLYTSLNPWRLAADTSVLDLTIQAGILDSQANFRDILKNLKVTLHENSHGPSLKTNSDISFNFLTHTDPLTLQFKSSGQIDIKTDSFGGTANILEVIAKNHFFTDAESEKRQLAISKLANMLRQHQGDNIEYSFFSNLDLSVTEDLANNIYTLKIQDSGVKLRDQSVSYLDLNINPLTYTFDLQTQILHGNGSIHLGPLPKLIEQAVEANLPSPASVKLAKPEIIEFYLQCLKLMQDPQVEGAPVDKVSFSFNHLENFAQGGTSLKIGNTDFPKLLSQCYTILYTQVAKVAAQAPNFTQKFQEIAPILYKTSPQLVKELESRFTASPNQ